ncbi:MAG: DciA family protein, partial [Gammaproteobacteria bacterium]
MASSSSSFKQALSEPGRILSHLYSHIDEQKRLLTALRKALPETLALHALYCLESDNKLLIYTDSQVWATQ